MRFVTIAGAAFLSMAGTVPAQADEPVTTDPGQVSFPGAGAEIWTSTDSDKTDVFKLLGRGLWSFDGQDKYRGFAVEHAWFRPSGKSTHEEDRIYLDVADHLGSQWRWRARVGTNGHTVLGSAAIRSADWSREFFVEREIVETPVGLDRHIYYTFAGASLDFPAGERDTFTTVAALQEFSGKNVRLHLRGNYVHVVRPALGLSLQLRSRYFHSTRPNEFDYYSPRNFLQAIPVVQIRRFDSHGWMYLGAAGLGIQKATGTGWQSARLLDLRIESPQRGRQLQAYAGLQYSNNSLSQGGGGYHYVAFRAGVTSRF